MTQQFNRVRGRTIRREDTENPTLDQVAANAARHIIRTTELPDTTENWKALKEAFKAGHAAALAE